MTSQSKWFLTNKNFLEQLCSRSYKQGVNPLPFLRKLFPDLPFRWSGMSLTECYQTGTFYIGCVVWHAPDEKFVVWSIYQTTPQILAFFAGFWAITKKPDVRH